MNKAWSRINHPMKSKIEKVPRDIPSEKVEKNPAVLERLSQQIRVYASPKYEDGTRCLEW